MCYTEPMTNLRTDEFDYFLPPDLIAQTPVEPRDASRGSCDSGAAGPQIPLSESWNLLALITLTIVGSFQTVGTLLVFGLLVGPPATAALLVEIARADYRDESDHPSDRSPRAES